MTFIEQLNQAEQISRPWDFTGEVPEYNVGDALLSDRTLELLQNIDPDTEICKLHITERDRHVTLINSGELVRSVLVQQHREFRKGPEFARIRILTGGGLIVTDGAQWRTSRRLVQPAFIKSNADILQRAGDEHAERLYARWRTLASQGATIDLTDECERYALNVMISSIFSDQAPMFLTDQGTIFDFLKNGNVRNIEVVTKVRSARDRIHETIKERHGKIGQRRDILDLLLEGRERQEVVFDDDQVVDELVTLIVAGYETTAILLAWVFHALGDPKNRTYLRGPVAQRSNRIESLARECLRLCPPVWMFSRRAEENVTIGDYAISKGEVVSISPFMLHRRQAEWHDPEIFRANRFQELADDDPAQRVYLPFSAGPRRCIGDVMSDYEIQAVVGRIAPDIDFQTIGPKSYDFEPLINLRSRRNLYSRLTIAKDQNV